jgi:hypothetical protein
MHATTTRRELAQRQNDGIEVTLLWCRADDSVTVAVRQLATEESFELDVDPARALDAFYHPFAFAARVDLELLDVTA